MTASIEKGKAAYIRHGCGECHDYTGQGWAATNAGMVIARTALPLDAFKSFLRSVNGAMPSYRHHVLTDEELDDIYAYL